jgi:hypothetical protein
MKEKPLTAKHIPPPQDWDDRTQYTITNSEVIIAVNPDHAPMQYNAVYEKWEELVLEPLPEKSY